MERALWLNVYIVVLKPNFLKMEDPFAWYATARKNLKQSASIPGRTQITSVTLKVPDHCPLS